MAGELPPFRRELRLFQSDHEVDGSPIYHLYDPIRNRYFKLNWLEGLILKAYDPNMTIDQLVEAVNKHSTKKVTAQEVLFFLKQAKGYHFFEELKPSEVVAQEEDRAQGRVPMWMMFSKLLFIRVPLAKPDKFLKKALPFVSFLFSKLMLFVYLVLTFIGLVHLLLRFEEYIFTFAKYFNLTGLIAYILAVVFVKIIHEFSHAFVSTKLGVRVQSMGIVFILLWPVLFTNVTDSWKLLSRRHRFLISVAGIAAELIIAGVSTFFWAISKSYWQGAFFILSSSTWISSLLVNLNPAVRFDGYYLLSDMWGIENLQQRAFAVTRWKIRKWLWGLDLPSPERYLSPRRITGFLVYTFFTWTYRLFIYAGIAYVLYLTLPKIISLTLIGNEILIFIVYPILWEVRELVRLRKQFTINWRLLTTSFFMLLLLIWFFLPMPRTHLFSAIVIPEEEQVAYVVEPGYVDKVYVEKDDSVEKGDILLRLRSKELDLALRKAEYQVKLHKEELEVAQKEGKDYSVIPSKQAELDSAKAFLDGMKSRKAQLSIRAVKGGSLYFLDENLKKDKYLEKNTIVGKIARMDQRVVQCYIPEDKRSYFKPQDKVVFRSSNTLKTYEGEIIQINSEREKVLQYPTLSTDYSGDLVAIKDSLGDYHLVHSYYVAKVELYTDEKAKFGTRGYIIAKGIVSSKFMDLWQFLQSFFVQESGV